MVASLQALQIMVWLLLIAVEFFSAHVNQEAYLFLVSIITNTVALLELKNADEIRVNTIKRSLSSCVADSTKLLS